jgi:hypothetical protein
LPIVFTKEDNCCLSDLLLTNPSTEKARIRQTKGGLLDESFRWVLDNPEFQKWRYDRQSRLLWIKGDAGKGKTMLMIGSIEDLSPPEGDNQQILSYFLCQGTDLRLNNAITVLRGLIYLLILQQPFLISHLRKQYDHTGRKLFENTNAFYGLSEIFQQMLQDPRLLMAYLAVDALDECEVGLPELLDLISQTAAEPYQVKWIVSSRNKDDIEQRLGTGDFHTRISLELNAKCISDAVNVYIDYKVSKLTAFQSEKRVKENIHKQLRKKANGTFLWVALVIHELQNSLVADMLKKLKKIPSDLTLLYGRIMKQIKGLEQMNFRRCLLVLSRALLAYRPLHLQKMHSITGVWEEFPEPEEEDISHSEEDILQSEEEAPQLEEGNRWQLKDLQRIIHMCGSFLTIREGYIYFIHQSAKDYLIKDAFNIVFPTGTALIHYDMFSRSLNIISESLRYNICNLQDFGSKSNEPKPDLHRLDPLRYSCVFWYKHLCKGDSKSSDYEHELSDNGAILKFFNTHFLHWLEALSLIHQLSDGILIIRELLHKGQVCSGHL